MAEEIEKTEEELNEEAQLAQEALEAVPEVAPEVPAVVEPDPKDAVIGGFRRELKETRAELARVRAAQAKPAVKSPLELANEQAIESGIPAEFTTELYNAQRKFEREQDQTLTEEQTYAQQKRDYDAGLTTVPAAELDNLITIGAHLLTEGDKRNAWDAGKNSGKELKRILNVRIEQAGLQPKPKVKEEDKPKKVEKVESEKPPELEDVLEPITASGKKAFDLFKK